MTDAKPDAVAMPADTFRAWMEHLNLNNSSAADALGINRDTVARYVVSGAPRRVALACSALAMGLKPWGTAT